MVAPCGKNLSLQKRRLRNCSDEKHTHIISKLSSQFQESVYVHYLHLLQNSHVCKLFLEKLFSFPKWALARVKNPFQHLPSESLRLWGGGDHVWRYRCHLSCHPQQHLQAQPQRRLWIIHGNTRVTFAKTRDRFHILLRKPQTPISHPSFHKGILR